MDNKNMDIGKKSNNSFSEFIDDIYQREKGKDDIKYCVTALIDLLGFSSHLELGKDLRTRIGQEAVKRLTFLEDSIDKLKKEKKKHPNCYPLGFNFQRINDSIILSIDLPEILKPSIGQQVKNGIAVYEFDKHFSDEEMSDENTFKIAYLEKMANSITALSQFIGLVCRIHLFINRKEYEMFYPGARTVIASGYRKSFITKDKKEDHFSANFSYSNAFMADRQIKEHGLFIDNYILHMLGSEKHVNNILRLASFFIGGSVFDPLDEQYDAFDNPGNNKYIQGKTISIPIFRHNYIFRRMNPTPLSFLQLFPILMPYLNGLKQMKNKHHLFSKIYENFKNIKTLKEIKENPSINFIFRNDIEEDLGIIKQLVLVGKIRKVKKDTSTHE